MKTILILLTAFIMTGLQASSQTQYEVTQEASGTKVLKGIINWQALEGDTSFKWFAANGDNFTPNAEAVTALKSKKSKLQFIVFGGTWCGDTKKLLPQFYKLLKAAEVPENQVTLIGVDRQKKTISHLTEALGIAFVPTFIVMVDGREVGRVVEYGKYGQPDREIGEIVAKIP